MTRDKVEWHDCCSLHAVTSSVIYYSTHSWEKCNLFVLYNKNSNGLLKFAWFWGMGKDKNKSSDVDLMCIWRHLRVCPNRSPATTNENVHISHVNDVIVQHFIYIHMLKKKLMCFLTLYFQDSPMFKFPIDMMVIGRRQSTCDERMLVWIHWTYFTLLSHGNRRIKKKQKIIHFRTCVNK